MLFLLLRLLTAPTTLFPAAAVVDTATSRTPPSSTPRPGAGGVDAAALRDARAQQATIDAGPRRSGRSCAGRTTPSTTRAASRSAWPRRRFTSRWRATRCSASPTRAAVSARRPRACAPAPDAASPSARGRSSTPRALCIDDELSTISATKYETVGAAGRREARRRHHARRRRSIPARPAASS